MHPLDGPFSKFSRAKEHLEELERNIESFFKPDTYVVTHKFDEESGTQFWRLDSDIPDFPVTSNLIFGEFLYNCRSALDHIVWQLVLANKGKPGRNNEFPITIDPLKFAEESKSKLKGVSNRAKAIIKELQPGNGGDVALVFLDELGNTDKHRHLNFAVTQATRGTFSSVNDPYDPIGFVKGLDIGPLKRGAILLTIPSAHVNVKFKPIFDLVISDANVSVVNGQEIRNTIIRIDNAVSHVFDSLWSSI